MKFNRVLAIVFLFMFSVLSVNATLNDAEAYWDWDTTGDLSDSSGNAHTLTNEGATFNASGKLLGAYSYDSTADHMDAFEFNLSVGDWTINTWMFPHDVSSDNALFSCATDNVRLLIEGGDSSSSGMRVFRGSWLFDNNNGYVAGQWQLFTLTYNGTTLKEYRNGVEVDSATTTFAADGGICKVGNRGTELQGYDGTIDEFSLYNRALSPTEIVTSYNGGNGTNPYAGPGATSVTTSLKLFYNTSNISVQINSTGIINLSYVLDGASAVSVWTNKNNGSVNITGIAPGIRNITWIGATTNLSELFIVDLTIPTLNVTTPTTINRYRMDFSSVITFNDTNFDVCRVKVEGVFTSCTNPNYNFSTNGNHSFNVSVNDSAGNINIKLNNIVFVNPFQNFTFTNSTGGVLSNFTFNSVSYLGNQAQILTFGGGLSFGNNSFLFEKLGFQSTLVNFVINSTSHLDITTAIDDAQINLRFFDRETLALISGLTTVTLVGNVGVNGTTTTGLFNISDINFVLGNYQVIGSNPSYFTESVFFAFTGQEVLQKDLYLISNSSTDAGTVTIQVTANTGQFVQGAICSALEWRPSQSAFVSVAEGNTNTEGATILNVEIGTKLYKFECSKDGISVTSPQQILQVTESIIPLVLNVDGPSPVLLLENLVANLYNITINATHQQIIYNFTSLDGLVTQACLSQYKINGNFRSLLTPSTCISSSVGQIQVVIDINQTYTTVMVATATQSGVEQQVASLTFLGSLSLETALNTYGFAIFIPLIVVIVGITVGFMLVPANMAITSIVTLIGMWFLRYIIPGIMSTSSTIFMSVILLLIMWGSKR